jgi:hypothetical protein
MGARRKRPCRRTAEPRDELPPSHLVISCGRYVGGLPRSGWHGNGPTVAGEAGVSQSTAGASARTFDRL